MAYECLKSSNQNLTVANNAAFQFGAGDFAVSLLVNPRSLASGSSPGSAYNGIISIGRYDDGILLRHNSFLVSQDSFYIKGTFVNWQSGSYLQVGSWLPIVITKVGSVVALYTSGVQRLNIVSSADISPTNTLTIGASTHATVENWDGSVAEVAIWKGAGLTAAEVEALSKGFTANQIRPQNLSFYAPLVRDLQDVRGGLTITNNNSATVAVHPRIIT